MTARVFIIDDKYTGQDKPLGIVVDTMFFIEMIDENSPHHDSVNLFFEESAAVQANLYMSAKTSEELMHRLQVYYTTEYAKQVGINPKESKYTKGNPGFKLLQKDIFRIDPNYFSVISAQRDAMLAIDKSIAEVIYPRNYGEHLEAIPVMQKKINGCVETGDTSTILIANEKKINTFATSDSGFYEVDGINIITPRKGIYTPMSSSKSSVAWFDLTK